MKVFCIGFNKTGTVSLHEWFTRAGLDSSHDGTYQKRTRTMDRAPLQAFLDAHEAFSDGERANVPLLRDLYPDARFVLNTRSLQTWLESRVKHVFRQGGVGLAEPEAVDGPERAGPWSGGMAREYLRDPLQAISDWVDRREYHHRRVIELFAGDAARDLLVLNVVGNPAWPDELATFLELVDPDPVASTVATNAATADLGQFDLDVRLRDIERVLAAKAIPTDQWHSEVYVGFHPSG
jgi:hypothetical protein